MTARVLALATVLLAGATSADAQFAVYDPAVTSRQTAIAALKELSLAVVSDTHTLMTTMSRRLASMSGYAAARIATWTLGRVETPPAVVGSSGAFFHTLNAGGDLAGSLSRPPIDRRWTVSGSFLSALRTLETADGVLASGADVSGQMRAYGRDENARIDRLESDVTAAVTGSTTAVLDALSGAALIGARQQEARTQLTLSLMEQRAVENLRARQTEAAGMRLRLGTLQHRERTATGGAAWADDLTTWRQP